MKGRKRARKLLALARRGVMGERETAQRLLEDYLRAKGLTVEDIDDAPTMHLEMTYRDTNERTLLIQIIAAVTDQTRVDTRHDRKGRRIEVRVEPVAAMEIERQYAIYRRALRKAIKIAIHGFIQANNIFPKSGSEADYSDLTDEEMAEIRQAIAMSNHMPTPSVRKALKKRSDES